MHIVATYGEIYLHVSYDAVYGGGGGITPCIKIDKPLVDCRFQETL